MKPERLHKKTGLWSNRFPASDDADAHWTGGLLRGSHWARSWQLLALAILNHYVPCSSAACELCVELAPRGDASPPAWGGWP